MRRVLSLTAVLAALALAGCGGDDESEPAIDVDTFGSCIADAGGERAEDQDLSGTENQPVAVFQLDEAATDIGILVPIQIAIFESESDANAQVDSFEGDTNLIGIDEEGTVVWLFPDTENDGLSEENDTVIHDCIDKAS